MILPRCSKARPWRRTRACTSRPPRPRAAGRSEMWSMVASSLARITGLRIGSTRMPVPILILVVRAAIAVRMVSDSMDREVRLDAEQDVVPHPQRLEAQLLHAHAVVDQRLRVRHLRIRGEVAHGDAERLLLLSACFIVCSDPSPFDDRGSRRGSTSRRVEPLGVELAQHRRARPRVGGSVDPDFVVEQQLEAGVVLHLLARDARIAAPAPSSRRVSSSKPRMARSVTTRHMPPCGSPLRARVSPPSSQPGEVMKSTCSTKRRFSCFIATIMLVRQEMSLPPPVPGRRVFGLSASPMNEELRLP